MHLKNGTLLQGGTYRIVRFIKSGGFGCTYEAVHQLLNKRVAIKEFFVKDFCNREETGRITVGTLSKVSLVDRLKQKFIAEASSLSALSHEGIVNVSNLFLENDTAYYVMDYIDGCSLDVYVQQNVPLAETVALDYIGQACEALKYVHDKNILHLDVKPGNLMLDKDGKVTLIDFGTSKQYDECDGENTSTLLGNTPGYASPEQGNSKVTSFTPATDVYSLGATLYKLLTGKTPPTASERSSGEEMDPLPENISRSTADAIMKAMILNKRERLQSVAEFQAMLVLKAVDGTPSVDEEVTIVSQSDECDDRTVYMGGDVEDTVVVDEPRKSAAEPSVEPELPLTKNPLIKKPRRWLWWVLVALIIVGVVVFAVMPSNTGMELCKEAAVEFAEDRENLSNSGRANCYIVSENGSYKFPTVKGNSSESVGAVKSVEVLWESFGTSTAPEVGDLIKSVSYSDGYITFRTADTFKEGNAVIAARNASGTILWSWHIWLTDQPGKCVYANNAGTMMDRNLGATSATPGDVGALGLLYQWGRKDPFLGSSSISDNVEAKSTITWPSAVSSSSSRGTVAYATEHPTTFITYNTNNNDWYYSGSSSTDNTRWQSTKTIYDPCPAGWRVPDGGSNGVSNKAGFCDQHYDSSDKGILFGSGISSPATWYPAAGYRYGYDGFLDCVGTYGYYWSVAPNGYDACYLCFSSPGHINFTPHNRAYGQSVRCLQE